MCTQRNLRHRSYGSTYEDSPESLLLLCARRIITYQIPFNQTRLPREVGHLLAREFKAIMKNKENLCLETDTCEKFYAQFRPEYTTLNHINFSDLPITDKFLIDFVKKYRATLVYLNISNCNKLTSASLKELSKIFSGKDLYSLRKKPRSCNYNHNESSDMPTTNQPESKFKHVYVGNGQVDRVPANTDRSSSYGSKPMSYITEFGRLDTPSSMELDFDRYDFSNDDYEDYNHNNDNREPEYCERTAAQDNDVNISQREKCTHDTNDNEDDNYDDDDGDDDDDGEVAVTVDKRLRLQTGSTEKAKPGFERLDELNKLVSYCSQQLQTYRTGTMGHLENKNVTTPCSTLGTATHPIRVNILGSRGIFNNNDRIPNCLETRRNTSKSSTAKFSRNIDECHLSSCWSLTTLVLGDTISRFLPRYPGYPDHDNATLVTSLSNNLRLKKLVAHKIDDKERFVYGDIISCLITPTMHNTLLQLDLSNSVIDEASSLTSLTSLRILILYNCDMTYPRVVSNICKLKSLRVLDISQSKQIEDAKEDTEGALKLILKSLPKLTSLDISGTQLVSRKDPELSGLSLRQNDPFEFLGLLKTEENASYLSHLPANRIAGDANESQILTSCEVYIKRPEQLKLALHELYLINRSKQAFDDIRRALHVVLDAMHQHQSDENIQIPATASLFAICRTFEVINNYSLKIKRLIVERLLNTMHRHKQCQQLLLNGSLILVNLIITFKTQAWINECYRLASISLHIINANYNDDGTMQRHGVLVLNSLACQVGGEQKILMADLKAIVHMIRLIKVKLSIGRCDEVLEQAWSTMWNITDESPVNCKRFLDEKGLEIFEQCMDKFPQSKDLIRNIMGLLGNVAECAELRQHFMEARFIRRFTNLLGSVDKIECSYNACGILAHLMSEGPLFWTKYLQISSWHDVLRKMRNAIDMWKICEARSINYRSFIPIIKLLEPGLAPEVQYWAVWALTNLTRVQPTKYCSRLHKDGGREYLQRLIDSDTANYVKNLAIVTLYQCEWFDESTDGTLSGFESCDLKDLALIKKFRYDASYRALHLADIDFMNADGFGAIMPEDEDED